MNTRTAKNPPLIPGEAKVIFFLIGLIFGIYFLTGKAEYWLSLPASSDHIADIKKQISETKWNECTVELPDGSTPGTYMEKRLNSYNVIEHRDISILMGKIEECDEQRKTLQANLDRLKILSQQRTALEKDLE